MEDDGEEIDIHVNLEDILVFATGAAKIPPMGFGEQPTVAFKKRHEAGSALPSASTCTNRLYLPAHDTYEAFRYKFLFGVTCAVGFGNV